LSSGSGYRMASVSEKHFERLCDKCPRSSGELKRGVTPLYILIQRDSIAFNSRLNGRWLTWSFRLYAPSTDTAAS